MNSKTQPAWRMPGGKRNRNPQNLFASVLLHSGVSIVISVNAVAAGITLLALDFMCVAWAQVKSTALQRHKIQDCMPSNYGIFKAHLNHQLLLDYIRR